jgi:hypothetical protein
MFGADMPGGLDLYKACATMPLEVGLSLHSRVSDWLHGTYRLSLIEPCFYCKGCHSRCQIGYMEHTGCHRLNRVLTHNNNVVKSGQP